MPRVRRVSIRRALTLVAPLAAALLLLAACSVQDPRAPGFFPPPSATENGRAVNDLYNIVFVIAAAVFVLVEGLLLFIVFRYRRRSATLPVQTHGNNVLEILWTAIPAAVVAGIFVVTFALINRVEARAEQPDVEVNVTGFQWQWRFDYPAEELTFTGLGAQGPEMVIPVNEIVRISLESQDVNHAFYVPQFLYKKDVIPGRVNQFDLVVDQPGTYTGQCAEFCGLSHAEMFFTVRAVERAEYDQWVAAEQEKARATPAPPPSGAPPGATIQVSASNEQSFDQASIQGPTDQPLSIQFQNNDDLPHNVAIKGATPEGDFIGLPIVNGGESATYQTPPLAAGEYSFFCSVHPNMQGTLTVE